MLDVPGCFQFFMLCLYGCMFEFHRIEREEKLREFHDRKVDFLEL